MAASELSVIVFDSEYILAVGLAQQLEQAGSRVAAVTNDATSLIDMIRNGTHYNSAILDLRPDDAAFMDLAGEVLVSGVPLVLTNGFDSTVVPHELAHLPIFSKPVNFKDIFASLGGHLVQRGDDDRHR